MLTSVLAHTDDVPFEKKMPFAEKAACQSLILLGLTSTGYFIYQGTQLAPLTQFLFAIIIQTVYVIIYPLIMFCIDSRWSVFVEHFRALGLLRATLCGCLWTINNVFITVPASHLSGFYQMMGISMSFVGCYFIEKIVQGTKYTRGQTMCVISSVAIFIMLAVAEKNVEITWSTIIWFICYLFNQVAANYAQVLMENAWKTSPGNSIYKVAHGNFVTNLCGMPFFLCSLPFYYSQGNNLDLDYIWIPCVIAISAIFFTFGSNVLLQFEDMTYSMMSGTCCNLSTLLMIVLIPWNRGSTNANEVTAYVITLLFAVLYMFERSDHSGKGSEWLQAKSTTHSLTILFLVVCIIVTLALASNYF